VNAAAMLMGDVRDAQMAQEIFASATKLPAHELPEDDRSQLELCLAQLLYYAFKQEAASRALSKLAAFFQSKGIVNSCLARVYGGLGAVSCYQGRYDQAKKDFEAAYSVAVRISNETQQAGFAANLALCCLRLGEYEEQLDWSKTAANAGPATGYQRVQALYYRAFALAMLGKGTEAIEAFDSPEAVVSAASPAWLTQAWRLHRADVLALSGERATALLQAKEAVQLPSPVLHAPSFAGSFARWLAIVSAVDGTRDASLRVLADLYSRLEELDTLDRVEVVCAQLIVGAQDKTSLQNLLIGHLAALPPSVSVQLRRLGAISA
jgi:tetratricopeptide (TPR) repeat protein